MGGREPQAREEGDPTPLLPVDQTAVFSGVGRLISHAGQLFLKIAAGFLQKLIIAALERIRRVNWNTV